MILDCNRHSFTRLVRQLCKHHHLYGLLRSLLVHQEVVCLHNIEEHMCQVKADLQQVLCQLADIVCPQCAELFE